MGSAESVVQMHRDAMQDKHNDQNLYHKSKEAKNQILKSKLAMPIELYGFRWDYKIVSSVGYKS